MESFGCWYKLNEALITGEDDCIPRFDLHVNFWFLGDILKRKFKAPYLDIGIKIANYTKLSDLIFSFPFQIQSKNIFDLAPKMSNKINASIVFNEECEIETQKEYTIIKIPDKEKGTDKELLIFPLKQAVANIFELITYKDRSYIKIKFDTVRKYLEKDTILKDYHDIYIRFRLKDINVENILYFDSEPFNKSLDSAFSGTRVLDFKINEKRNIDKNIAAKMDIEENVLAEFDQVHFLVMEPSSYDMISYTQNQMTCRELEKDLWNDYLTADSIVDLNDQAGHILAYHWRVKAGENDKISDFSCFAKINYQKMQIKTVSAYVLVILGIGVIGSTIVSATPILNTFILGVANQEYGPLNFVIDSILGGVMILIGWLLGKSK